MKAEWDWVSLACLCVCALAAGLLMQEAGISLGGRLVLEFLLGASWGLMWPVLVLK
jgi:hypothetical protein